MWQERTPPGAPPAREQEPENEQRVALAPSVTVAIASDNGVQFTSLHVRDSAADREIEWRTVATYNLQGKWKAERMVGAVKDTCPRL